MKIKKLLTKIINHNKTEKNDKEWQKLTKNDKKYKKLILRCLALEFLSFLLI